MENEGSNATKRLTRRGGSRTSDRIESDVHRLVYFLDLHAETCAGRHTLTHAEAMNIYNALVSVYRGEITFAGISHVLICMAGSMRDITREERTRVSDLVYNVIRLAPLPEQLAVPHVGSSWVQTILKLKEAYLPEMLIAIWAIGLQQEVMVISADDLSRYIRCLASLVKRHIISPRDTAAATRPVLSLVPFLTLMDTAILLGVLVVVSRSSNSFLNCPCTLALIISAVAQRGVTLIWPNGALEPEGRRCLGIGEMIARLLIDMLDATFSPTSRQEDYNYSDWIGHVASGDLCPLIELLIGVRSNFLVNRFLKVLQGMVSLYETPSPVHTIIKTVVYRHQQSDDLDTGIGILQLVGSVSESSKLEDYIEIDALIVDLRPVDGQSMECIVCHRVSTNGVGSNDQDDLSGLEDTFAGMPKTVITECECKPVLCGECLRSWLKRQLSCVICHRALSFELSDRLLVNPL